ncbi:hypothetical protein CRYUN_Cryun11dG0035000 [Craigia yunnanensis]
MDPEVIEIPPPIHRSFKSKQKQVVIHEVIDVDKDEDSTDIVILDERVDVGNKGKAVKSSSGVYSTIQAEDFVAKSLGSVNKVEPSKLSTQGSHNIYNLDFSLAYNDEFFYDYYLNDFMDVDEYAMLQAHFDNVDIPAGVEASIPWFADFSESKKETSHGNISSSVDGNDQSLSSWLSEPAHMNKKAVSVSSSSFQTPGDPLSHSPVGASLPSPLLFPQGSQEPSMSWWLPSIKTKYSFNKHNIYSSFHDPIDGAYITPEDVADIRNQRNVNEEDILSKLQLFKQFDTVEDFSDHHYASSGASMKQPPKNWAKKIQEEWKILEKDLPDTIVVRVYESRMDLLRAVIIGAEGTPYHDGLFFFDVFFPASYPKVPPHVYYHSGGLRLNPNLYSCGKVCLSLLNTWSGNKNEKWLPGMSTMLQVLVSIQALILNQKPYFNEPGLAHHSGTPKGELLSRQYNEDTFILSLKTMIYSMRRQPKHFEDFVVGHFYRRAHDILVTCKAYMNGAQVGCLIKGGVQDVDEGNKSCSQKFKDSLAGCVNMLVKEFTVLGVKDCEKLPTAPKSQNNRVDNMPKAAI